MSARFRELRMQAGTGITLRKQSGWVRLARWIEAMRIRCTTRPVRQLHLRETLGLGEKRFLAVVEFERQRFLIGGASNSVALLTELGTGPATPAESQQGIEP